MFAIGKVQLLIFLCKCTRLVKGLVFLWAISFPATTAFALDQPRNVLQQTASPSTGTTTTVEKETAYQLHLSSELLLDVTVARRASTVSVTTEVALKAALVDGNTVMIMQNITLKSTIDISSGTIIIDGQGAFSINGNGTVQCISISGNSTNVTFIGLTIENGNALLGGGFSITGGMVTLNACTVFNNTASGSAASNAMLGGGLFIDGGSVTMTSCTVSNNFASPSSSIRNSGGGLYLKSGTLIMISCNVSSNLANAPTISNDSAGGGLLINGGALIMTACIVTNNSSAGGSGGGLSIYGGACTLTFCTVSENSVTFGLGGGIIIYNGALTMTSCTVTNNSANFLATILSFNNAGGGLFINNGTCTLTSCTITNNSASDGLGGGIIINGGALTMISCIVANNSALGGSGGGLNINGGGLIMISCTVTNNIARTANDVYIATQFSFGQVMNVLSNCAAGQFTVGSGVLDCVGCPTQVAANLLTTNCTVVPSDQYSCCGATSYLSFQPACSPAQNMVCSLCPPGQFSTSGSHPCTYCATAGRFSNTGGRTCEFCPTGRFNSGSVGVCEGCPVGKFSTTLGATASSYCTLCPDQLVSIQGSSSCDLGCPAGYFLDASNTCSSCSAGQYQATSRQRNCVQCSAGRYLSTTGQTSSSDCASCLLGKQSSTGASSCTQCSAGQYGINSPAGNPACTSCPAGTSSEVGVAVSTGCIACSAGQFSPGLGMTCVSCVAGLYLTSNRNVGSSSCVPCPPGTASRVKGAQSFDSCVSCVSGRTSPQGSSNCPEAAAGRYLSAAGSLSANTPDLPCPTDSLCQGNMSMPRPVAGSWSSHASLELADRIFSCDRMTCLGAADSAGNTYCWEREGFASEACQDASLTCSDGAVGPLCGSCLQGYTYSASKLMCTVCGKESLEPYIAIGMLGALRLIGIALHHRWALLPIWVRESWIVGTLEQLDSSKLRIAWTTYQIIGSVSVSLSVEWPTAFQGFLRFLSIFSFDFLSSDCIGANPSFYQTVIIWTVTPVIVSGVLALSLAVQSAQAYSKSSVEKARKSAEKLFNSHLNYFLALTYLVLPAVLLKQFQALDCIEVAGKRYVKVDTSLDCDSPWSQSFRILDGLFIAVYLGIPALWLLLLCRRRSDLNPCPRDLRFALFLRDRDDSLEPIRFLFDIYLPQYYYFEVVEMGRRVGLVGVLPLLSNLPARRACYGLCFSLCGWAVFRETEPFRDSKDNSLNYVAQVAISLTYGAALVIATELNKGIDLLAFGAVLVSVNVAVLTLAVLLAHAHWRFLEAQKAAKLSKRATKIEHAVHFDHLKFQTTFEALEKNQVATSECVAFWYCSLTDAQLALQQGIPASKAHNGIIFSFHRPYQLDNSDRAHFADCSAVVVVALPRRLLIHVPTSVAGPCLRLLPAETLLALRSPFFQDLVDPEHWQAGEIFFPPLKIVRVFQLPPDTRGRDVAFIPLLNEPGMKLFDGTVFVPRTCADLVGKMQAARSVCNKHGWVPLYHYTDVKWTRSIIEGGFRMSTQGQGDGGVYFSVRGPTSYGIGTDNYEANIITDCFGAGRMHEYLGKRMLDVVFVYGIQVGALTQAPGGRDNAFMVSKALFELLALPAPDGNYFLRPDRILGVFLVLTDGCLPGLDAAKDGIESERCLDLATKSAIVSSLWETDKNDAAIATFLEKLNQIQRTAQFQESGDNSVPRTRLASRLSSAQENASENRSVSLSSRIRISSQQGVSTDGTNFVQGRNFSMSNAPAMRSISRSVAEKSAHQNSDESMNWANAMVHSDKDSDAVVTSHNFL